MGLGGARTSVSLADDETELEWVDLRQLTVPAPRPRTRTRRSAGASGAAGGSPRPADQADVDGELGAAMIAWLRRHPLWVRGTGPRLLLVDLDNLRAAPARWAARMQVVLWLAGLADHVVLAGQHGAVARAQPHLAALGDTIHAVDDGSDLADHVLLDAAEAVVAAKARTAVISNDGIFVRLAGRGPLTVLSPGLDALSEKLRVAASRVVDLTAVEEAALAGATQAPPRHPPDGAAG